VHSVQSDLLVDETRRFWPSSGSVRTGLILPREFGSITAAALSSLVEQKTII